MSPAGRHTPGHTPAPLVGAGGVSGRLYPPPPREATRRARERLEAAAQAGRSEAHLDRLRALWGLAQLVDAGVVRSLGSASAAGRWLLVAEGHRGERSYSTRELEGFVHGAEAALEALEAERAALRVLAWSPATRAWLEANDPKALAQADDALGWWPPAEEEGDAMRELSVPPGPQAGAPELVPPRVRLTLARGAGGRELYLGNPHAEVAEAIEAGEPFMAHEVVGLKPVPVVVAPAYVALAEELVP